MYLCIPLPAIILEIQRLSKLFGLVNCPVNVVGREDEKKERRERRKEGKKKRRNKGRRRMFPKHTYKEICHFLENRNISDLRLLEEEKKKKEQAITTNNKISLPFPLFSLTIPI